MHHPLPFLYLLVCLSTYHTKPMQYVVTNSCANKNYIACWYYTWLQRFCEMHKNNLVWYLNQQDSLVLVISNDRGSLNQTQIILEISRRAHDLRNHNFTHFGISLIIGEQSPGSSQKRRMCDKAWSTTASFNGKTVFTGEQNGNFIVASSQSENTNQHKTDYIISKFAIA